MNNLERLMKKISKTNTKNILIHTIPKTSYWLICEKIQKNEWLLTLCNPKQKITYNLGIVNHEQYINLWNKIIELEIETKISQVARARKYKLFIKDFINNKKKEYESFLKKHDKINKDTKKCNKQRKHRIRNKPKLRNQKL